MIILEIFGGPIFKVDYLTGMDIRKVLEVSQDESSSSGKLSYSIQFYGNDLGYLVNMVNETYDSFIAPNQYQPFYYWEILQNGIPIQEGIDHTVVKDGDIIIFIYTQYNQEKHVNSTLRLKHVSKNTAS